MRKLRIAIISGGTFIHAVPYIRYFVGQGHEVHWITFTTPGEAHGATIHDVSSDTNPLGPRFLKWRYLLATPKVRRILHRLKPDILHGHYATSAGVLCAMSGFRPYIISCRGSDLIRSMKSFAWKRAVKRVFDRAVLVHTVSDQLASLARELGVPDNKVWALTQGVDTDLFNYTYRTELSDPVRLLCTRTLRDVYDPFTIVHALARLAEGGVPFEMTFAAGGLLRDEVEELVSANGLQDRVTFLGGYDNGDLPQLLERNDIYVSANQWDGTSISLLEVMSKGVFPVVSRIESTRAWVEDGVTALMFDPGNADELAEALKRAIQDRELRDSAARVNREVIERRADRRKNMEKLEKRYFELLNNR